MKIGKSTKSQNLVFSLEKDDPSSSSSSVLSSSSSSSSSVAPSSSSSSSVPCGPFDFSITTELGANSEIPDFYYADAVGVSLVSVQQSMVFEYDNLNFSGPAFIMDIEIGGELVASATVALGIGSDTYLGKPFLIVYDGVSYCGIFINGTVSL